MPTFHFMLTLSGVTTATPGLEDALYEAGCDDALVCFYGTAVYLEFDRRRESLETAVLSAIQDVESADIPLRVESVDSALVGLSDIAELTGLSRQAVALLKDGTRGTGQFPGPVQRVKGNSPLWRWSTVAEWFAREGRLAEGSSLAASARILDNLNLALQLRSATGSRDIQQYMQALGKPRSRA
ncbi:helix-turn-helix transcriptional regulator [[Enterobacter] lignolyticus]|uniref:DNA-binding protein n=1 Tax=[Enterobacter] lignolyticus TaxID=1334193 RepID=A0A806X6U9_9ENTR|nr:hypothetical protein [[Enterobacter] lignolyticus]ALR77508.1 DNA-binding protein [[Enterobacter] lignolyticus]